jgi:hypothetical protein
VRQEKKASRVHTHPKMGATVFNYSTTATVRTKENKMEELRAAQVRFCRDRFFPYRRLGAVGLGYRVTVQAYPRC